MRYTGFFEDIRYDEASESRRFYELERETDPLARWDVLVGVLILALLFIAAFVVGR